MWKRRILREQMLYLCNGTDPSFTVSDGMKGAISKLLS